MSSCGNSNKNQTDTTNIQLGLNEAQPPDTVVNESSESTYDLDSILNVIKVRIDSMPQRFRSYYYDSEITDDHIDVSLSDSCDKVINSFKEHVVDSPVVRFQQVIGVIDLLWLEIDMDEIESSNIEESLDEDTVDSNDSIVSDTLHHIIVEQETTDSVAVISNL